MSKLLIILLAVVVLLFAAFSFLMGMVRRFLGFTPGARRATAARRQEQPSGRNAVLYHDNATEVLRGESERKPTKSSTDIRDAAFTENKGAASSRR